MRIILLLLIAGGPSRPGRGTMRFPVLLLLLQAPSERNKHKDLKLTLFVKQVK